MPAEDPQAGGEERGGRKAFLLRVSPELMEELRTWSAAEFRSLNAHIEYLLRQAVARRRGSSDPPGEAP